MTRYRITVEYEGSGFVGWQRQDNGFAVQEAIEQAIEAFSSEKVTVFGAGRTDAGVHALGQVAHFDLVRETPAHTVREALNHYLRPVAAVILDAAPVDDDFHARFSAIGRRYLYRITNRRSPLAIGRGLSWRVAVPLDAAAMHDAAQVLVGHHDFTSFRATVCQAKSAEKTIDRLDVERDGDEILIHVEARSFLHHQVRNIVGTLKWVGEGKWGRRDVEKALAARRRAAAGETAPAEGLYLVAVRY